MIALCDITDSTGHNIESSSFSEEDSLITSASGKSKKGAGRFFSKTKNLFKGSETSKRFIKQKTCLSKAMEFIQSVVTGEAKTSSEGPLNDSPYQWVAAK